MRKDVQAQERVAEARVWREKGQVPMRPMRMDGHQKPFTRKYNWQPVLISVPIIFFILFPQ